MFNFLRDCTFSIALKIYYAVNYISSFFFLLCSTLFLINFCLSYHKLAVDATLTNKYSTTTRCKWLRWYRCTAGAARQVMVTRRKISHVMNLGREPWQVVLPRRRWHAYNFRILPVVILSIHFNFLFNNNCRNLRPAHMIREPSRKDHNPSHVGGRNFSLENNYKFLKCGK